MPAPGNLADPDYEPSDEDIAGLMRSAFQGLKEAREKSLVERRDRIKLRQTEIQSQFRLQRQEQDKS
jgi:hypothetical protein